MVTIAVMVLAPRVTTAVPAAILALLAGTASYFGLSLIDPALLVLDKNPLVIGALGGEGGSFTEGMAARWQGVQGMGLGDLRSLLVPALTLAVLLSIDTLKTCVVLDALTRSRHDSNRELIGQGLGNVTAGLIGGMPGAGQMGATMVNMSSGAVSRMSGVIEGVLALVAFLLLGRLIAWVPVAALAAILIVVGIRMIDRHSFQFLKSRNTIFDFVVILAVVTVALTVGLIPASATGVVLAIVLFIREQIGGSGRAAQGLWQPVLFQADPPARGHDDSRTAGRSGGDLRAAGQPLLRHRQSAVHQPRARDQGTQIHPARHDAACRRSM